MSIVVVDKLSERNHFIPSKQVDTAPDVARRFFDGVVRLHGMPSVIISDRDPKFTSLFWSTLFERFGTRLAMSSANHPQSDGQTERMIRTLKEMLSRGRGIHKQREQRIPFGQFACFLILYNSHLPQRLLLNNHSLDIQ
jgi:hypothetical protein